MTGARPPATAGTGLAVALAALSVVLSAAPRALLAGGALPDAARPFIWSDVYLTYVDRLSGGGLPYFEVFFEYPPLVGYLAGVFVRVTSSAAAYLAAWAAVSAVAAGAVALLLARAAGPSRAIAFWSLSPQLLLYGGSNFDVLAAAFLLWAVMLSRGGRRLAGIAVLAVGALVKAFPAVAAPLEIDRIRRTRGVRAAVTGTVAFVAVALAVATPSLLARHPVTESAGYVAALTNFDSAWGLVLAAMRALGVPGAEAVVIVASAIGMLGAYLYVLARRPSDDPARLALLGLLAVLLWTRLYSPQYSLWVVPFFALLPLAARTFAVLSAADVIVFATVYPLTLLPWADGDVRATLLFGVLAAGIVLRHASLILAWRELWSDPAGPTMSSRGRGGRTRPGA